MLTYAEALDVLRAAERFGIHPSLDGIRALTDALAAPQDAFASIQVTGTNGKSSTTRVLSALLVAHGVRAGAYTSPELESMTERIEILGEPATESDFARAVSAACSAEVGAKESGLLPSDATLTQFELLTAAALWLFRARKLDVACLEVGMGGRWDATSVVRPVVSVITGVGIDHVEQLGTTREAIAEDKAHIIKPGTIAVLGPTTAGLDGILLDRAALAGATAIAVREVGEVSPVAEEDTVRYEVLARPADPEGSTTLWVGGVEATYSDVTFVAPAYQAPNVATAIASAQAYLGRALDAEIVRGACAGMTFPGRFEVVEAQPPLVIDGAHNPQAAAVLAGAIRDAWPDPSARPALLLGVLADKDARAIVVPLAPVASSIAVTRSGSPRALGAEALASIVEDVTGVHPQSFGGVGEALDALAGSSAPGLVVTGSITTAAEARRWARELRHNA